MIETLIQRIECLAIQQQTKLAVTFKTESLTYGELYSKVLKVASRMNELGIEKGDRVLFSAISKPEMVVMYLSIQFLGGIAVFVDKNATPANAANIYKDAGAKLFFTDKPVKGFENECSVYSLRKIYSEEGAETVSYDVPDEGDLAELIYTSGTTGKAKGCMLTYKSVCSIWRNTIDGIGMRDDDIILLPLPLNHSFALRVLRAGLYLGATVVLQNGFTFAREIENNLDRYSCTSIAIVPASVETILKQMQDKFSEVMGRFRYIEVSAGSLSVEQRKRLTSQLPNTVIHNTWGSSESGGALFLNVTDVANQNISKISALGKPLKGIDVVTLDEKGDIFESDQSHPGRMTIRGDMQMVGYWNQPELTAQTLKDGWLLTGDMIYRDADGYLYMIGRADDIINVGGEKVSPIEVENAAGEFNGISECACIGVADPEGVLGSVPVLFFASNRKCAEDDFRKFLSSKLEKYKIPVRFIEILELPRNAMQKVDKAALKCIWEEQGENNYINDTIHTIMTRRSIRRFKEQKIDKNLIKMILRAGYYAPSGHNMQTWKFTVITNLKEIERLKEMTRKASEGDKDIHFYGWENPVLLILVSNDERNADGCQDASCASENMMLAAWSYGIGSVWLNPLVKLRNKAPVSELLDEYGVPKNHVVWSAIAMGYPVADGMMLKKNSEVINWIE